MVMGNPATLAEFWATLPIQRATFSLSAAVIASRTEGGDTITARRGTRLWQGQVSLAPRRNREAEAIKARLAVMADAGQRFMCYPVPVWSSDYDRDGSLTTPQPPYIGSLPANGVTMSLGGLPPAYQVAGGEFLSFTYGSNPTRYALHQIVGGTVTAAGDGTTAAFEVRPAIRDGAQVNAMVRLYQPRMAAIIVPGSIGWGGAEGVSTGGLSFDIIQTLRG